MNYRIPARFKVHEAILGRNDGMFWPTNDGGLTFYCCECGQPMSVPGIAIDKNGKLKPDIVCPEIPSFIAAPTINCPNCKWQFSITFAGFRPRGVDQ